jgi:hypothetical protein
MPPHAFTLVTWTKKSKLLYSTISFKIMPILYSADHSERKYIIRVISGTGDRGRGGVIRLVTYRGKKT